MTNLVDLFNPDDLSRHVSEGNISERKHPRLPLYVYNYTAQVQWTPELWDEVTTQCRGLVLDEGGEVVARPYKKFFNLGELDAPPSGLPDMVQDKLDGALGVSVLYDDELCIATRGSFESEQALWATDWIKRHHPDWQPREGTTTLFEILCPESRVVVNYQHDELVLLTSLQNSTGEDRPHSLETWEGSYVENFDPDDPERLAAIAEERDNAEGFVMAWTTPGQPAFRVKVKSSWYTSLHKVVTGLSNRIVWEHLANGTFATELLPVVPDEFHDWLMSTHTALDASYRQIDEVVRRDTADALKEAGEGADRRMIAEKIKAKEYPGLCFALLDGKDIAGKIWKQIRPERELPVLNEQDR